MTRMAWTAADGGPRSSTGEPAAAGDRSTRSESDAPVAPTLLPKADGAAPGTVRRLASVWSGTDAAPTNRGDDRVEELRAFYERCHADMVRFAAFLSGNATLAEDIAHEAFVRVIDAWDRIDDPGRADAYLRTTVVNVVRSGFRRDEVAARRADRALALVPSAEEDAIGRLGREVVLAAVASLPLKQRACVVMRHWMRMSESEIAETLGVSVGSVRTHVKRGTATLKDRLGGAR